ncbi:MAG: hypothetical protein JKX91_03180 [Rhizobiaceae bacterium]|nr:hypothetical protein [Rhizobiaceae bacterium]
MNTQFYFHRLAEGVSYFAGLIGLSSAFSPDTELTLNCHRINTRFIREARIPSSMEMKMGIVSVAKQELTIFAVLTSAEEGTAMASFLCRLNPASPTGDNALIFSDKTLDLAQSYSVSPPQNLLPRTFEAGDPSNVSLPDLAEKNFNCVASGAFLATSCDGFGKMRIDQPVARLSAGMTTLMADIRRIVIEHAPSKVERIGGAMLEAKFDVLNWARLGEAFELWSKITHAGPKLISAESWLINPHTKSPLVILQTASAVFDLDARAIVPVTQKAAAEFEKSGIPSSF